MSTAPRVLVCDDEPQIVRALRVILRDAGYEAVPAGSGEEALDRAAVRPPEAAIIDLMLPDLDGVEVTARLREWSDMPIIVLSAVGEEEAKVRALTAGADDYVTKPFGPPELVARLQAVMRRAQPDAAEPSIEAEGIEIDLAARSVRRDGEPVHLTPTEFGLLRDAGAQPREADDPPGVARRGLGTGVRRRLPGAARPHRQPAPQDRARERPPLHPHRPRRRLPLRPLAAFTKSVYGPPFDSCGLDASGRMIELCSPAADIFPGGGGLLADAFAIVIAIGLFALLYWAIDLIDRV